MQHRISLKNPSYDDYAQFYDMRFTSEVVYWADDEPRQMSLDEYALGRLTAQGAGEIIERIIMVDGVPVGTITARDFVNRVCQCTLGIVIADPRYWGHGYGSAALKLFMVLLAEEGVGRVILETYANNKRAQRCFHKIGFQKKRVFFAPNSGRFVVQMCMSLAPKRPIGEVITRDDPRWRAPKR